jgi:hypothetical protein
MIPKIMDPVQRRCLRKVHDIPVELAEQAEAACPDTPHDHPQPVG